MSGIEQLIQTPIKASKINPRKLSKVTPDVIIALYVLHFVTGRFNFNSLFSADHLSYTFDILFYSLLLFLKARLTTSIRFLFITFQNMIYPFLIIEKKILDSVNINLAHSYVLLAESFYQKDDLQQARTLIGKAQEIYQHNDPDGNCPFLQSSMTLQNKINTALKE